MKKIILISLLISSVMLKAQNFQICEKDSLFGVCDSENKPVIPMIYNSVNACYNYPGLYVVESKGKYGILNDKNKVVLPIEYEFDMQNSNPFNFDGQAYYDSASLIILKHKDKYGMFDASLKIVIPFEFDYLEYFYYYSAPAFVAKKGKNFMLIDIAKKVITKNKYIEFAGFYTLNWHHYVYAIFKNTDNQWVFVDEKGKEYTKALGKTDDDRDTLVRSIQNIKYNGKSAAIDYQGNMIATGYDYMTYFETNKANPNYSYAVVGQQDKYGILRNDGKIVLELKYDKLDLYDLKGDVMKIISAGKEGLVSLKTGKELLPAIYDEIYLMTEPNFCSVKKGEKYALMKHDGTFLTEFIFDDMQLYAAELFGAKQNGKWGYIDQTGKVVIPFQFDRTAGIFSDKPVPQQKDGKFGYINKKGETVIPFKYDKAEYFYSNTKAEIILNDKKGWVDLKGNETWR